MAQAFQDGARESALGTQSKANVSSVSPVPALSVGYCFLTLNRGEAIIPVAPLLVAEVVVARGCRIGCWARGVKH